MQFSMQKVPFVPATSRLHQPPRPHGASPRWLSRLPTQPFAKWMLTLATESITSLARRRWPGRSTNACTWVMSPQK